MGGDHDRKGESGPAVGGGRAGGHVAGEEAERTVRDGRCGAL